MNLSPERDGRFTASGVYRLMAANGQVDWTPDREGGRGVGYTCWTAGKQYVDTVFQTVAAYDDFVRAERARLGEFTLSVGAKSYAEEKAMELLFGDDEYEPQLQTLDTRRGNEREALACVDLSMHFDTDLFFTGDNQRFIAWGADAGATPDGCIGSENGVTFDAKSPKRANHLSNILTISGNESLLKSSPAYYWQQQCQIAAAEQDYGYWVSYNPTAHNPAHGCMLYALTAISPILTVWRHVSRWLLNIAMKLLTGLGVYEMTEKKGKKPYKYYLQVIFTKEEKNTLEKAACYRRVSMGELVREFVRSLPAVDFVDIDD